MTLSLKRNDRCRSLLLSVLTLLLVPTCRADSPNPVLQTVFPPGGQAGTSVTVAVTGAGLEELRDLRAFGAQMTAKKIGASSFNFTIPAQTPPGIYDLRALGRHGISTPRAFFVSNRPEQIEIEPNNTLETAQHIPLDVVVNGRIDKQGDVDCYRFTAKAGQRVVLECWAERLDSQLRGVLEVCDSGGRRLAANRGHAGSDPLIDFTAPADGTYCVKLFDLSFLGGNAYFYRLDVDTKPRVEFALPSAVTAGQTSRIKLFGRNLLTPGASTNLKQGNSFGLDFVEVELTPPQTGLREPAQLPLRPAQLSADLISYCYPGSHVPIPIGVTDVPVILSTSSNGMAEQAQEIAVPCEVSGQLTDGDQRHWYAVRARKGEVFWLEAFGERIGAPVNLAAAVLDAKGERELVKLEESRTNFAGNRFPTAHTDPAGRFVAPADGRYLLLVRNLTGGLSPNPRWIYRLSVRREEPTFDLAVLSRRTDQPASLNVPLGGREAAELLAIRRRGFSGPIRVTAERLPPGIQCPDVWIGAGEDRAPLVLTAERQCPPFAGGLNLVGHAEADGAVIERPVRGGTMIWPGQPVPSARLTQEIALATTAAQAGMLLTATPSETAIDQGSVLDVAVELEQRVESPLGPIQLSGIGLPRAVENATATLPAGKSKGWISFYVPASLPPGPYTFCIAAQVESAPSGKPKSGNPGKINATLVSNPITINVRPARILLEVDPQTPRKIGRGQIVQLRFTAERAHGFIGKIHTELAAPDGVVGLRGRGVTLVGQTDSGTLQVIATETAPLGKHLHLRLEAVGTVEDQPVYRASRFVELEITE